MNAAYARRMHHRRDPPAAIVATTIMAVVAGGMIVGIRGRPTAQYPGVLFAAHGFKVDWQLEEDNWLSGGPHGSGIAKALWWDQSLDPVLPRSRVS